MVIAFIACFMCLSSYMSHYKPIEFIYETFVVLEFLFVLLGVILYYIDKNKLIEIIGRQPLARKWIILLSVTFSSSIAYYYENHIVSGMLIFIGYSLFFLNDVKKAGGNYGERQ